MAVRLAERLRDLHGNHRHRPPYLAGVLPLDREGTPLPYRVEPSPHQVVLSTPRGALRLTFLDEFTLHLALPEGLGGVRFRPTGSYATIEGGHRWLGPRLTTCRVEAPHRLERVERGEGEIVDLLVDGSGEVGAAFSITPETPTFDRLPPPPVVHRAAAERWAAWFRRAPDVPAAWRRPYYAAWYLLRSHLLSPRGSLTREGLAPSKDRYLGVWHWDALFHALALRHVEPELARDQIRLLLDHQLPNGMLPDVVHDEGLIVEADGVPVTKPPLLVWAALQLVEEDGDASFLAEVYEPAVRWTLWWFRENDDDGDGVVQYDHPFSSGLDNSPLWDDGVGVEAPDLNTFLVVQLRGLAALARRLGRRREAERWSEEAHRLARRVVDHFYDPTSRFFWHQRDHRPVDVPTPFGLLPLWTGALTAPQREGLLAWLRSPQHFATPWPVPTVSRSHPSYDPEQMWRGPTWVNVNYLLVEALRTAGCAEEARRLADRTLALVAEAGEIAEYYHPEAGAPPERATRGFGWSAALFVDLLLRRTRGALPSHEDQHAALAAPDRLAEPSNGSLRERTPAGA